MKQALALGTFGGVAIAGVAFVISAGLVPALLFGLLAGVPAMVLAMVATGSPPPPRLAPLRSSAPVRRTMPAPQPDMAWDDETDGWAPPKPQPRQPRREHAAYCSPLRYDPLTMIRENSYTYDLARVTAAEPDELDDIDDLDIPDELDDWGDEPDELPVAVPNWPRLKPVEQPAVVEPEPVPAVVGWTAARFAALEIER